MTESTKAERIWIDEPNKRYYECQVPGGIPYVPEDSVSPALPADRCIKCEHLRSDCRRRGAPYGSFCIPGCGCECEFPAPPESEYVRGLECAMCGAPNSFVISPLDPAVGYCFKEQLAWRIKPGGGLTT